MKQELKIRIRDYAALERALRERHATLLKTLHVKDTYFHQPKGKVLKITEDELGIFLVRLEEKNGMFLVQSYKPIANVSDVAKEMEQRYGIKRVLTKERIFYKVAGESINLNRIDGLGDFCILENENPTLVFFRSVLGIQNPESITVPFDELT